MKKRVLLLFFVFGLGSCIKESVPECPYQYRIQLFVQDKNYFNLASVGEQPVDEGLPFRQYVGGVYYVLHNTETGEKIYGAGYTAINGDETEYPLTIGGVPDGRYLLTVWGNLTDAGVVNEVTAGLHPMQGESSDIYVATDTLVFTSGMQSASMGLERVKGNLRVICKNFPNTVTKIDVLVTSLFDSLSENFTYSGMTDVVKSFPLTGLPDPVLETFLAPTVYGTVSGLSLTLYDAVGGDLPIFTSTDIDIDVKRNEITTMEINYNTLQRAWEIWILIDNKWTMVYNLSIVT